MIIEAESIQIEAVKSNDSLLNILEMKEARLRELEKIQERMLFFKQVA